MRKTRIILATVIVFLLAFTLIACNPKDGETTSITYTVHFESNGGSEVADITVDSANPSLTLPINPTKEGYEFVGWFFDNNVFAEAVTPETILSRLSETATEVTVYANWVVETTFADAVAALDTALNFVYAGTNNAVAPLTATQQTRLAELDTALALYGDTLEEKYWNAVCFTEDYSAYLKLLNYKNLIDGVGGVEYYNNLTTEQKTFIDEVNDYWWFDGDTEQNYNSVVNQLQYFVQQYSFDTVTQTTIDQYNEFILLSYQSMQYDDYSADLADFETESDAFLATLISDDIRKEKLFALATFLTNYNYTTLLVEYDDGHGTYMAISPATMLDFMLDMVDTCDLTNEDVGALFYRFLDFGLTNAIADCDAETAEIDIKLTGETDVNTIAYYNGQKAQIADEKETLQALKTQFNATMVTSIVAVAVGGAQIINDNDVVDLWFNAINADEAPTLAEMAAIFASMKGACDDFLADYNATEWAAVSTTLTGVFDAVIGLDNYLSPYFTAIRPLVADIDFTEEVGIASRVLALATSDNLDVFLNEITVPANDNRRDIEFDKDNPYLFDNLVILEAKLITAITDNTYDQTTFAADYADLLEALQDIVPFLVGQSDMSENEANAELITLGMQYALDIAFDLLEDKIVISSSQYTAIQTVAAMNFVTSGESTVTEAMYSDVIAMNAFYQIMQVYKPVVTLIVNKFDNGVDQKTIMAISAAMYILDVDDTKLTALNTALAANFETYDFDTAEMETCIAIILDSFYDAGFTKAEIVDLVSYVVDYAAEFGLDALPVLGINNTVFNQFLTDYSASSAKIETLMYFALDVIDVAYNGLLGIRAIRGENYDANLPGVIDTVIADLQDMKTAYDTTDEAALGAVFTQLLQVAQQLFYINIQMGETDPDAATVDAMYGAIIELFGIYGFDGAVDKAIALLEESKLTIGYDIGTHDGEPTTNRVIFIANIIVILFGAQPDVDFADVIDAAGTDNDLADYITTALSVYDDIEALAAYDYGFTADEGFNLHKNAVKTAFDALYNEGAGATAE